MENDQILNFPKHNMGFKNADTWLSEFIQEKCPNLTKVYVDRG